MSTATATGNDVDAQLRKSIARYRERDFDWHAFPSNEGYAALERAQARFVGSGASPKTDDSATLKPDHFTVSLIHQEVGKYAALHAHEVEESFFIFEGVSTVGWELEGDLVEIRLGPKDMISNAIDVPHGFRNDGVEPVLLSVMVGSGKPEKPRYHAHPMNTDPDLCARLGVQPEKIRRFDPFDQHPLQQLMAKNVVRYIDRIQQWHAAGFAHAVYVGEGGIAPWSNRKELITLPRGVGVVSYARDVEDVYFVTEGVVTVGWEEDGKVYEQRLGARDVVFNPAGRPHYFRNQGVADAQFLMVVGSKEPESVKFKAR